MLLHVRFTASDPCWDNSGWGMGMPIIENNFEGSDF
jgi:hypothetical protein